MAMTVALLLCASAVVIFGAKRTWVLSALTNPIARFIVARIDNPMLIPFWMNPEVGLIERLCVESITLPFGLLVSYLANFICLSPDTSIVVSRK